jgi:molecular chaperone GrpE
MQPKDHVEKLRASIQAKKESEARAAAARQEGGLAPGIEDQYKQKIDELEEALSAARQQAEEWEKKSKENHEQYVRLLAEFDNFRKRMAREKDDVVRYGHEKIVRELLPVLDGLEKALEHATEAPDKQAIIEGVELVLKQFLRAMENFGVRKVEAVGQPFDPHYHEAMGHHESEAHEPDTVVNEYRSGFTFHDRLLRPALVTVAKPPEDKNQNGSDEGS